jgi:signal recognition particle GTPase
MTIAEEIEVHRNRVANGNGIGHAQLSRLLASYDRMVAALREIDEGKYHCDDYKHCSAGRLANEALAKLDREAE